ncbi:tyrosine-type recombinase/integrase [Bradyrhizobium sp.]|uniref:tyrosine-type recombinase/integrase n=1 Tax=Bradyrhizobium sp. TaxID=376 RepID=UPI003BAFDFBA
MPRKVLTDLYVEKIKPTRGRRVEIFDANFPGLALRVSESGRKSWSLFYRLHGGQHRFTIGAYPQFLPAAARTKATEIRNQVDLGVNPAVEKRSRRNDPLPEVETFETVLADYFSQYAATNMAPSTYAETKRQIERDVLPHWKDLPLRDIRDRHVLKLINDIAAAGNGVTANRTFSRLRAFFNWSISQLRLETSPARGLVAPVKEEARDRALSDDEIRWFWSATEEIGWPFGPIARLLLLTAQRRDEVSKMSWSEIDLAKGVWVIPAERARNSRAHEVHLSAGALVVLKGLPKPHRGFVFSVTGDDAVSGFSRAKDRIDAAMKKLRRRELRLPETDDELRRHLDIPKRRPLPVEIPHWTLHDLRRTAVTKMAEDLKIAPHIVDKILNHASGTIRGVAAIYNRAQYLDERRAALEAWSNWILALTNPNKKKTNVVGLRR